MPLSLFSITLREYENIRFDASDAGLLGIIIWGLCIGAVLASLLALYQQKVPGKLVRALLRAEAHDEDSAKTLDELGLAGRPLIARELRRGTVLQKFVYSAENGAGQGKSPQDGKNGAESTENGPSATGNKAPVAATARYYVPEELKYRAATRYDKKENGLFALILTTLLSVAMAVLLMKLIPPILSMIDGIL